MNTQPQSTSLDKTSEFLNTGNLWGQVGDKQRSLQFYKWAEENDSNNLDVWIRLASYYLIEKDLDSAWSYVSRLVVVPTIPDEKAAEMYNLIATYFRLRKEPSAALGYCHDSLRKAPDNPSYHTGLSHTLHCLGRHQEAMEASEKALQLAETSERPYNKHQFRINYSLDQLLLGDYAQGLKNYEFRRDLFVKKIHGYEELDLKQDIKDILIIAEQGYGDIIMMMRFAGYLKRELGVENVGVLCDTNIFPLLHYIDGIDFLFTPVEDVKLSNIQWKTIPMFSLLSIIPRSDWGVDRPYVNLPSYVTDLVDAPPNALGICWRGNPEHQNDFIRSVGFKNFTLFDEFNPWPVQYGATEEELTYVSPLHDVRRMDPSASIFKQACNIAKCKCVLTVDTMTSHLAGALGVPCVQLTAVFPDWRWGLDSDTTIWYPKHKLIRQKDIGSWDNEMQLAQEEIRKIYEQ